jgi:anti-sigma factor RsiW
MNITHDVVKDLVTVYLAGEASADTRALVEDWLRSDPELAAQVERARGLELPAVAAPAPTVEKLAFDRTRRRLRGRGIVLGAAIYFTTLPLTVTFGSDGFHGLLLEDWSARIPALAVAAALWVVYWRMSRRLGASGL